MSSEVQEEDKTDGPSPAPAEEEETPEATENSEVAGTEPDESAKTTPAKKQDSPDLSTPKKGEQGNSPVKKDEAASAQSSKSSDKSEKEAAPEKSSPSPSKAVAAADEEKENKRPPSGPASNPLTETGFHHHVVPTERSGALNVYVQGDLEDAHKEKDCKCVFLTVHDIGNNHRSFKGFVDSEQFEEVKKRSIFIHIDVPGQESNSENLKDGSFPTIQALGEDLVTVLDQLRVKYCIGIGDGAGANIIARFGMMHVTRCLGVILLHPTANASTIMDNFKDKFQKFKIKSTGENIVAYRKYGHKLEGKEDKESALEEYKREMRSKINSKNLSLYMDSFHNRSDITTQLKDGLKCDALVVVGNKTSHVHAAEYMHSHMDKTRSSLLKVDNVGHVLDESPAKLANSILLFCKGLGWLTSVDLPGVERRCSSDSNGPRRQRSISMEDYDKPNIRRLSVSSKE